MTALEARIDYWRERGWQVRVLDHELRIPAAHPYSSKHIHGDGPCERSDRVRLALQALLGRERFDGIEFPSLGGLGYRAIQAKRAGLGFANVALVVHEDGFSAIERQRQRRWPDDPSDLEVDHAESYAVQKADSSLPREHEQGTRLLGDRPLVTVCVPYFNLGQYLPETLASLAAQTYSAIEVIVIDDGSTDTSSRAVFKDMQERYSRFQFHRHENAGIGATRNRGLALARGDYFVPMDADNIARPDMIERFVQAIRQRPDVAVLTCYFLAFATSADLERGKFLHAYRPTGGPHILACLRNVYGDATAIYRTAALRAIGGWETDRGTSFEDWEAFVKLVHAGHTIDVIPEHLFYYRHLETGFSRTTDGFANHERILRQFRRLEQVSASDRDMLWNILTGLHRRVEQLDARQKGLPSRLVDRLRATVGTIPWAERALRWFATRNGPGINK